MARKPNKKRCPRGQILRKGYRRSDGTYVPPSCIIDRGAPGKGPKVVPITHEGKLGGPGYLKKSDRTRHGLLNKCVKKHGYRSCLGSINALGVLGKREFSKSELRKIVKDREYLVEKYGGEGSFSRAANPRAGNPEVSRMKNRLTRY